MQAIYDVVGDKIQEIFDAQGTCITIVDEARDSQPSRSWSSAVNGCRRSRTLLNSGFTRHVLETS